MHEETGAAILNTLRKKWVRNAILSSILIALAISGILSVVLLKLTSASWWCSLLLLVTSLAALLLTGSTWKIRTIDIANFLNKKFPELEESAGLLLMQPEQFNLLQTLQAERTLQVLQRLEQPSEFAKPLRRSIILLLISGALSTVVGLAPFSLHRSQQQSINEAGSPIKENILPGIQAVAVTINPPLYTRHSPRQQAQFNILAEEGATLQWILQTNKRADSIILVFNDSTVLPFFATDATHTRWKATRRISSSGFYQVRLDGKLSEFYKIEAIKDNPPVIAIASPKPNITIDYGEPQQVTIDAAVTDDYGVKNAVIVATTASGNGEAVKFKEQTIPFAASFSTQAVQYRLQKTINLSALGMQPADELYFYIKATDNNGNEKRSDVYIATLADTAQLMESDFVLGDIKLKPEYFRSQRQIIIETEQLLKDKDTLSTETFNNRSNNLGIDQKLLRLRYGKFLGDEEEGNEASGNAGNPLSDPANFGNAAAVQDAFTDKHDNAEDATFFSDDVKKQLKATLTEMWNAETRLRTFKPQDALPYEYKALRLLKDLQQKSRVYVAKTSFKTPPLKPEKRLTGELDKIIEPQTQANVTPGSGSNVMASKALSILEQIKANGKANADDAMVLQAAMHLMADRAAAEPAIYVRGLQSLTGVVNALQSKRQPAFTEILFAESALQKMISDPAQLPQRNGEAPNQLQQLYFRNLSKNNQH